jgi:hypothetical protein
MLDWPEHGTLTSDRGMRLRHGSARSSARLLDPLESGGHNNFLTIQD